MLGAGSAQLTCGDQTLRGRRLPRPRLSAPISAGLPRHSAPGPQPPRQGKLIFIRVRYFLQSRNVSFRVRYLLFPITKRTIHCHPGLKVVQTRHQFLCNVFTCCPRSDVRNIHKSINDLNLAPTFKRPNTQSESGYNCSHSHIRIGPAVGRPPACAPMFAQGARWRPLPSRRPSPSTRTSADPACR
jgi:hypothetical protein